MKIVLYTSQSFLQKEINKSETYKDILIIKRVDELYENELLEENIILLQHLDLDDRNLLEILKNDFRKINIIALRNNTNNIEGCSFLKKGYKSYAHSLSNITILDTIIQTVQNGNTWIYPELMQFLISSVPVQNNNENKLLEKISIKELEVLELVAQGLNNATISKTLDIAEVTVKKHISSMFKKLEVKDRLALALFFKNNS